MRSRLPWERITTRWSRSTFCRPCSNQQGGATRPLLQRAGANLDALQQALQRLLEAPAVVSNATGELHACPRN
jgi:hypothetical protein